MARRPAYDEPGVAGGILECFDQNLSVIRLGLPRELRRSLARTDIIENALETVRPVVRDAKRRRNADRRPPVLRSALQDHV